MKTIKGCWIWEGAQTGGLNYKDEDRYPAVWVCESKKSGGGFTCRGNSDCVGYRIRGGFCFLRIP